MAPTDTPKVWTLNVNGLHTTADFHRSVYHVVVPNHVPLRDVLNPLAFGANFSSRLRKGDLIDVVSEDFELDVQLRVFAVQPTLVQTRLRVVSHTREIDEDVFAEDEAKVVALPQGDLPDGYEVRAAGGKYYVRLLTTEPPLTVHTGIATRGEAVALAIAHAEKQKAA